MKEVITREIKMMYEEYPKKWDQLKNLEDIKSELESLKTTTKDQLADNKNTMLDVNNI